MQQRWDICVIGGDSEMWPVSTCVVPGVCSIGWGAGSISQRRGMGSQTSRAAAQTQSKTACTWFMLHWNKLSSLIWLFLPLTSGNGSIGRSYVQSGEEARDVSKLQLQRQVQPPDWHLCCKGCGAHAGGQQDVWLWWVPMNIGLSHSLLLVSLSPRAGLTCLSILLPVPVANKRDTRSIEEAMNEIRAKKRQKQEDDTVAHGSSSWFCTSFLCVCVFVGVHASKYCLIRPEMQYMYSAKGLVLMTVVNTYMLTILLLMYWWSGSYVCLNWKTGTLSLIFCHF